MDELVTRDDVQCIQLFLCESEAVALLEKLSDHSSRPELDWLRERLREFCDTLKKPWED